jgi:16S rRNA (guanine966-N2)-methyltransferase
MRVIAGSAGGVSLAVPKHRVRPTMDRVKAAIFSSLGDAIIGARVLDLFAGSGALGIEALSRGAASAVFIESDRQAVATIERNLARTKLRGRVLRHDVGDFLRRRITRDQFDIIFADPPYQELFGGKGFTCFLLKNKQLAALITQSGLLVLEKRPGEILLTPHWWQVARRKRYGATEVVFLHLPDSFGIS